MSQPFARVRQALEALEVRGLPAADRARLDAAAHHWGPGTWQRVADLRIGPRGVGLREIWASVAPTVHRRPRPHEMVRQMARGTVPGGPVRERAEAPATVADLLLLFEAVGRHLPLSRRGPAPGGSRA